MDKHRLADIELKDKKKSAGRGQTKHYYHV